MRAYRKTHIYFAYDMHSESGETGKGSVIYAIRRQKKITPALLKIVVDQIKRKQGVTDVVITNIIYM